MGRNEFINQVLLKVEEGKVFLSKNGIKLNTKWDNIRIMNDSVSISIDSAYIRLNNIIHEVMLLDQEKNEVYVYEHQQGEVKLEIVHDACHIEMEVSSIKPISLEALMRILVSLQIPYSSRYLNRLDIEYSKYTDIKYDSQQGLTLMYGDSEFVIMDNKIIVNGLTIDITNHSYFIGFDKGVMSIMF